MYPINVVPNMEMLNAILGGEIGALPTMYLGMPLGTISTSSKIWNIVIEKCEENGMEDSISIFGSRSTLTNFVLDALPTYMMYVFTIPTGIMNRLDKIRRNFLWQENKERNG